MSDKLKDAYARYNLELAWDEFEKSGEIANYAECALQSADYFKDNYDKLVDFVKLVANSDTRTHAHKRLAKELLKELGHEI